MIQHPPGTGVKANQKANHLSVPFLSLSFPFFPFATFVIPRLLRLATAAALDSAPVEACHTLP
jgi:hypothetical protein